MMKASIIIFLGVALTLSASLRASTGQSVGARLENDRILIQVDGETFTKYHFGEEHKYPFFYPVTGPASARSVTAWDQEPFPHQSSLFFSLDHVRSENVQRGNYWQPRHELGTGQVFSRNARIIEADGTRVVLSDLCDWIVPNTNSHQFQDTRSVVIWAPNPEVRIMDFEITLVAMKDVNIRQTPHSFFAARMRPEVAVGDPDRGPDWVDSATGTIVDSDGNRNAAGVYQKAADWIAYYGENDGSTEGLAILQHSGNPFYPAKWFARDYGLVSPTPFAFDGNRRFEAGETLEFRYRVVVFTGDHETADIAGWHRDFEATASRMK